MGLQFLLEVALVKQSCEISSWETGSKSILHVLFLPALHCILLPSPISPLLYYSLKNACLGTLILLSQYQGYDSSCIDAINSSLMLTYFNCFQPDLLSEILCSLLCGWITSAWMSLKVVIFYCRMDIVVGM